MQDVYDKESDEDTKASIKSLEDSFAAPAATESGSQKLQDQENIAGLEDSFAAPDATESGSEKLKDNATGKATNGAEEAAPAPAKKKKRDFRGFLKKHKKKAIGGGVAALIMGGSLFAGMPILAAAQVVHVSHILQRTMGKNNRDTSSRTDKLFKYIKVARVIRKGTLAEARVGIIGSTVFGSTVDQLNEIGVDISVDGFGRGTVTFDTGKLKAQYPELEGMSDPEVKAFLTEKIPRLSTEQITGSKGLYTVETKGMSISASRLLVKNSIGLLDDGVVTQAIKGRIATKYLGLPSLFHPLERVKTSLINSILDKVALDKAAKEEALKENALADPIEATANEDVAKVKAENGKFNSTLAKALLWTGAACFIRGVADSIININHARVVLPAVAHAFHVIAVGEQMQAGKDFEVIAAAAVAKNLTSSDGKGIWTGRAINALSHDGTNQGGVPIPENIRTMFQVDTTAVTIRSVADEALGGESWASKICSPAGVVVQFVIGTGLAFGTLVAEVGSVGALTPGIVAVWAGVEGIKFAVTAGIFAAIQSMVVNNNTAKQLTADAFRGPEGGNLLAYGARAGSNMVGASSGGISLGNNTSTMYVSDAIQSDQQKFKSKNTFARIFDVNDYQSLTGQIADSISPNMNQNVARMGSSMLNMASVFSKAFASFLPKAHAKGEPLDWGFPQYGIPESMLNDPALADPYANAHEVVSLLNGSQKDAIIKRAADCFGTTISQTTNGAWDSTPTTEVNFETTTYVNAHCDQISPSQDPNKEWRRVIMFIFDTHTAKAAACFQGDEQSCSQVTGG